MPRNQHYTCTEDPVVVKVGEAFDWVTNATKCHVHMLKHRLLDKDDYDIVKGTPTTARVIGPPGDYLFECKCEGKLSPHTNPHIIVNP